MPRQQRAVTLISPSFFASEGIDLIHAIEPASAILAQVLQEAEAALARSFFHSSLMSNTDLQRFPDTSVGSISAT